MIQLRAKIKRDGATITECNAALEESISPAGLKSWSGSFFLPPTIEIEPGERYIIEFEDGREGAIIIRHHAISSAPIRIHFLGSGDLVRRKN